MAQLQFWGRNSPPPDPTCRLAAPQDDLGASPPHAPLKHPFVLPVNLVREVLGIQAERR